MPYDPSVAIRFAAFSVSGMAIANNLTQQDVDDLLGRTEEALDSNSPLFRAITAFATMYPLVAREPGQLAEQGQLLRYAIDEVNAERAPADPWAERKDLHG